MQFKSIGRVTRMSPSVGTFKNDDGEMVDYDNTNVIIETELKEDMEGFGIAHPTYKWGDSSNYHKFVKTYPVREPFDAEITWQNVSNGGKTSTLSVIDVKPLTNNQTEKPTK